MGSTCIYAVSILCLVFFYILLLKLFFKKNVINAIFYDAMNLRIFPKHFIIKYRKHTLWM